MNFGIEHPYVWFCGLLFPGCVGYYGGVDVAILCKN